MTSFTITREMTASGGRYVATAAESARAESAGTGDAGAGGGGEAELTFTFRSPTLVLAEHAYAPDAMRGTGIAKALVERLVADARREGFKITPLCPYIRLQFQRNPDWADVLQSRG